MHVRSYVAPTPDVRERGHDLGWLGAAEHILDEARDVLADVPDVSYRAVAERSPARALHSAAGTTTSTPRCSSSARPTAPGPAASHPARRQTRSCTPRPALSRSRPPAMGKAAARGRSASSERPSTAPTRASG